MLAVGVGASAGAVGVLAPAGFAVGGYLLWAGSLSGLTISLAGPAWVAPLPLLLVLAVHLGLRRASYPQLLRAGRRRPRRSPGLE